MLRSHEVLRIQMSFPTYKTSDDLILAETENLLFLQWHVEHSENSISLHRKFKNGKPMVGADISLEYEEFTYDAVYDFETGDVNEENKRKRVRPWSIRGRGKGTNSFGSFEKAFPIFMAWANELAPVNK